MTIAAIKDKSNDNIMPRKKSHRIALYSVMAFAILLVLLPLGLRIGAEIALKKFGAETATIRNMDLNLFTGTFAMDELYVSYLDKPSLSIQRLDVDVSILALFKKQLLVENLAVKGLHLAIFQQEDAWVVGIPLPETEAETEEATSEDDEQNEPSDWVVGIQQLTLDNISIDASYQEKQHNLQLDTLALNDVFMWQPKDFSDFSIEGSINQAPLSLRSQLMPFADTQQFKIHLALDKFDLAALQGFLPEDIHTLAAKLSINTNIQLSLHANGDIQLQQEGMVDIALDDISMDDIQLSAEHIIWGGTIDLAMANEQDPIVDTDGSIRIGTLNAQYMPLLINTHFDQLEWQGQTKTDVGDIDNSLKVSGQFILDNWHLFDQQLAADLASFEQLLLQDIRLEGLADIQLAALQLKQLQALQNADTAVMKLGDIQLDSIAFKALHQLAVEKVTLTDLQVAMSRNSHGHLEVVDEWLASLDQRMAAQKENSSTENSTEEATPATEDATESDNTFSYRIAAIQFAGDNPITLKDTGVTPAVSHSANIKKLAIGRIDSQNTAQRTPLDIELQLYRHGSLSLEGDITPLEDISAISGKLNAAIKGIDLTDISPYIEQSIGYSAKSGQFNSDTQATMKQGQLDSETKVRILRVDLRPADEAIIAKASQSLTMPVSTALRVITDGDNNLKLTVPVKGDLSRPDVKINKIMAGAITQAVKNSAMTYFKYAMQPFGAILLVSQAINDKVLQARFEDVRFNPGTAEMVAEQASYLEKVAKMIQDKKDFSIIACVMVTDEDFLARRRPPKLEDGEKYTWDEESQTLAADRLEFIRSTLIQQHGLSSEQIQSCKPSIGKGIPRAVMGI